ncbi:hypothetical protein HPB48_005793 [Haemaphysalis longicornis]|uniref:Mpv17-like protein n=1 Tax=Haemaphysalis longicornis TaxID=44386 RepID=A0A9J6FTH9_HAELO|nr:hypothetical protein HPB48_005793 [Haemaphysalis longicornis]
MQRLASSLRRGIALFRERPLLANMVSYPTLYVCAEFSQQTILMRLDESRKNYDWKTMVRYAIFATTASAPFLHYWYRYLDRVIPAKGTKEAIQKALTDQAVSSTILLAIFYTCESELEFCYSILFKTASLFQTAISNSF